MHLEPTIAVIIAVAVLAVGPALYWLGARRPLLLNGLDGFVLASVGTLVVLFLLPEAVSFVGIWAVVGAGAGLAAPQVLERLGGMAHRKAHALVLGLAVTGLVVHAIIDGIALTAGHTDALPLAVILHRLPVGLAIWVFVRPDYGARVAAAILGLVGLTTIFGSTVGVSALSLEGPALAIFQAFISGSLLHVMLHSERKPRHTSERAVELLGFSLGIGLVALSPLSHEHAGGSGLMAFGDRLLELCLASSPALLIGYLLAGGLTVLLPRASMRWIGRGSALAQSAKGVAFGAPLPVCSCGVVPLYQSLVQRGVPATAGMAFLVATPELGIESIMLSYPLLGLNMTVARVVAAVGVALFVGWLVGRKLPAVKPSSTNGDDEGPTSVGQKVRAAFGHLFEVVDNTAAWMLVGLAVAALVGPGLLGGLVSSLPPGADVFIFALVGMPLYVCASGATPLAAALIFAGVSPGAALAFLLSGPATNVTTFGVLQKLHGKRIALWFGLTVVGAAIVLGLGLNLVLGGHLDAGIAALEPHAHGVVAWTCFGLLSLLFVHTLVRQGPRGFMGTVLDFAGGGGHGGCAGDDDGHGHDHDHDAQPPKQASSCGSDCC